MRYRTLLIFAFATLLAFGPAFAQIPCHPSWVCQKESTTDMLAREQREQRQRWERDLYRQQQRWELELLRDDLRRERALRAKERNRHWQDSESGLYTPHRSR